MRIVQFFIIFLFALLSCSNLLAEENPFQVTLDTKITPLSDVEAQGGEIEIFEAHFRIIGDFKIFDDIPLKASIGGNHYVIEDEVTAILIPDSLKSRGLRLTTRFPLPFDDYDRFYLGRAFGH